MHINIHIEGMAPDYNNARTINRSVTDDDEAFNVICDALNEIQSEGCILDEDRSYVEVYNDNNVTLHNVRTYLGI